MTPVTPLVSVVIPTYNAPHLLMKTLQSVFAQSFKDFEVLVVDDGSTDDTAQYLKPFVEEKKIRVIHQKNGGIGQARDVGIQQSKGRYIALLDHDDLWMPEKLKVQVEYFDAHPECSAVMVPWAYSTNPSKCAFALSDAELATGILERPLAHLARGNLVIMTSGLMINREKSMGLEHGRERRCMEDTPFHAGLFTRGKLGIAGTTIQMIYQLHPNNASGQADYFLNSLKMLERNRRLPPLADYPDQDDVDGFIAYVARVATVHQLRAGRRRAAFATYWNTLPRQLKQTRWKFVFGFPFYIFFASRGRP